MLEANLIEVFTEPLENQKISYMVTGSVASIIYGEPRLTHDVDLVIDLKRDQLNAFLASFPLADFYCPPKETILIEIGRESRSHFNLIHHETGFKADCYLMGKEPLHMWALKKSQRFELTPGKFLSVAPREYVIIRKLEYYREGESQKHLDDIKKMLPFCGKDLDRQFLDEKLTEMGLVGLWNQLN